MTNGACCLQLKLPAKFKLSLGFWNFLERYGFRYGDRLTRTLLPCEVWHLLLWCSAFWSLLLLSVLMFCCFGGWFEITISWLNLIFMYYFVCVISCDCIFLFMLSWRFHILFLFCSALLIVSLMFYQCI